MPAVATIQLGDLVMEQSALANGVRWLLEPVAGWEDDLDVVQSVDQRAGDHGAWMGPGYDAPRILEVKGSLIGHDWNQMTAAINLLRAAVPAPGASAELVVSILGGETLVATVRKHGKLLIDREGAEVKFSLSLIAPDPRRYSVDTVIASTGLPVSTGGLSISDALVVDDTFTVSDSSTAGVLSVTNAGNMPTRPTLTIAGPTPPSMRVTHLSTGKSLFIPEAVAAGRSLVIDTDSRRALLDGTAARVVTGTWFEYAPGTNEVAFAASTYDAGALLTSSHRSAWR